MGSLLRRILRLQLRERSNGNNGYKEYFFTHNFSTFIIYKGNYFRAILPI
jgi:hypothetical protein